MGKRGQDGASDVTDQALDGAVGGADGLIAAIQIADSSIALETLKLKSATAKQKAALDQVSTGVSVAGTTLGNARNFS